MQLSLTTTMDKKYFWAFALDSRPPTKKYTPSLTPRRNLRRYQITACSRQAKSYGVKIGMTYDEARKIVPHMRVIVCNR